MSLWQKKQAAATTSQEDETFACPTCGLVLRSSVLNGGVTLHYDIAAVADDLRRGALGHAVPVSGFSPAVVGNADAGEQAIDIPKGKTRAAFRWRRPGLFLHSARTMTAITTRRSGSRAPWRCR